MKNKNDCKNEHMKKKYLQRLLLRITIGVRILETSSTRKKTRLILQNYDGNNNVNWSVKLRTRVYNNHNKTFHFFQNKNKENFTNFLKEECEKIYSRVRTRNQ